VPALHVESTEKYKVVSIILIVYKQVTRAYNTQRSATLLQGVTLNNASYQSDLYRTFGLPVKVKGKKGKDVDLYSAFHAPGTPNAHTSLKLTRQTAI